MLLNKYDLQWAMEDEEPNQEMMRSLGLNVIDAKRWW